MITGRSGMILNSLKTFYPASKAYLAGLPEGLIRKQVCLAGLSTGTSSTGPLNGLGVMKEVSEEFRQEDIRMGIPQSCQCNLHMPHKGLQNFSDIMDSRKRLINIQILPDS